MKPRIIVLGGCGFIGRNLVDMLVRGDLVQEIRVVDKAPPQTAWLCDQHKNSFSDEKVTFISANLINPESCNAAFARDDGLTFDFAVNCACETRSGQSDPVYAEGILKLSLTCAKEAQKAGVRRFVELSTGQICGNRKVPCKEDDKMEPYTTVARWKCRVEKELSQMNGLNYVIVRPAIVYGLGDRNGLMPLLIIGAIYKHLGECMKLLWSRDLPMNTVHVIDLCRAIWHILNRNENSGQVYNVVDEGNSTLGHVTDIVSEIFRINVDFWGTTVSSLVKADLDSVAEDVNDKHLGPWATMCDSSGVANTPLSPFLDKESLSKNHVNLDGSKLQATGFNCSVPRATAKGLREVRNEPFSLQSQFLSGLPSDDRTLL